MKRFLILLCVGISTCAMAQKEFKNLLTQTVRVHTDSSKIKVSILAETIEVKLQEDRYYYSLKSGHLKRVKGMIVGKVLEGPFEEFDEQDNIMMAGNFSESLMHGTWKTWYPNGELKSIVDWKKGKLHGSYTEYAKDGSLLCELTYKDGNKNGKCVTYHGGEASEEMFKDGVLVEETEEENESKGRFWKVKKEKNSESEELESAE